MVIGDSWRPSLASPAGIEVSPLDRMNPGPVHLGVEKYPQKYPQTRHGTP